MKLRGAISGFGQVAALGHLPGWRTRPDVEIVAVHDPLAARRHQALTLMPGVQVYEDLDRMLRGERLDFLDIASPPAYHSDTARIALEAGVHLLIEKPLCLDLDEFDQLATLANSRGRMMFCAHNWKHAPPYRRAGELLAQGRLGELRYVALNRLRTEQAQGVAQAPSIGGTTGRDDSTARPWRLDAASGGGILIDHGWHVFYLMHWLMGHRAPETINARLGFSHRSSSDRSVDDVADLGIAFGDGKIGYAHLSWRAPVRRTSATLYGEDAMLEIEGNRLTLTPRSGRIEDLSVTDAPDDSYHSAWFGNLAAEFERVVSGDKSAAVGNRAEARAAVALILAARKSHQSDGSACPVGAGES
jgi:predicted dehydrogenase